MCQKYFYNELQLQKCANMCTVLYSVQYRLLYKLTHFPTTGALSHCLTPRPWHLVLLPELATSHRSTGKFGEFGHSYTLLPPPPSSSLSSSIANINLCGGDPGWSEGLRQIFLGMKYFNE